MAVYGQTAEHVNGRGVVGSVANDAATLTALSRNASTFQQLQGSGEALRQATERLKGVETEASVDTVALAFAQEEYVVAARAYAARLATADGVAAGSPGEALVSLTDEQLIAARPALSAHLEGTQYGEVGSASQQAVEELRASPLSSLSEAERSQLNEAHRGSQQYLNAVSGDLGQRISQELGYQASLRVTPGQQAAPGVGYVPSGMPDSGQQSAPAGQAPQSPEQHIVALQREVAWQRAELQRLSQGGAPQQGYEAGDPGPPYPQQGYRPEQASGAPDGSYIEPEVDYAQQVYPPANVIPAGRQAREVLVDLAKRYPVVTAAAAGALAPWLLTTAAPFALMTAVPWAWGAVAASPAIQGAIAGGLLGKLAAKWQAGREHRDTRRATWEDYQQFADSDKLSSGAVITDAEDSIKTRLTQLAQQHPQHLSQEDADNLVKAEQVVGRLARRGKSWLENPNATPEQRDAAAELQPFMELQGSFEDLRGLRGAAAEKQRSLSQTITEMRAGTQPGAEPEAPASRKNLGARISDFLDPQKKEQQQKAAAERAVADQIRGSLPPHLQGGTTSVSPASAPPRGHSTRR